MAFSISPGVNVTEIDLTTVIPAVSTTDGAFVGEFRWGPGEQVVLVGSEDELVRNYGKPDVYNAPEFFTCASFLAYGNKLNLVRAINSSAETARQSEKVQETVSDPITGFTSLDETLNAPSGQDLNLLLVVGDRLTANSETKTVVSIAIDGLTAVLDSAFTVDLVLTDSVVITHDVVHLLIKNDLDFETFVPDVVFTDMTIARFPGALGNGLKTSFCPSAGKGFHQTEQVGFTSSGTTLTAPLGVDLNDFLIEGSVVIRESDSVSRTVVSVANDGTTATLNIAFDPVIGATDKITTQWEFYEVFGLAPNTSTYASNKGGSGDEVHAVVVDGDGKFSGLQGTVLEKYSNLSKLADAKTEDGTSNYFKEIINRKSKYVRVVQAASTGDWADSDPTHDYAVSPPVTEEFAFGSEGTSVTDGDLMRGYDLFRNAEVIDVALILTANYSASVCRYVISNLCEYRKDCIALISPQMDSVVNVQDPLPAVIEDREDMLISSSYAVMDSGWKYMYDKYSDVYRWVPLNGDIAGLCVRTDTERNPWWSPAGLNRGGIKNIVKLAYNPEKADRDNLYLKGINPVISIPGQGVVLYGDKTMLGKSSAFDRINVRRLFIVLEKAIALAARFFLFEFNDDFTRAQFRSMVEPYLKYVQAARGIYDFRVVCDSTNNTAEVIDRNEFVGDIYIKPARSINFIQLNFIAVRTGVAFEEIVGKF
jgi:phage tail sheath protein FI